VAVTCRDLCWLPPIARVLRRAWMIEGISWPIRAILLMLCQHNVQSRVKLGAAKAAMRLNQDRSLLGVV